MSIRRLLVPMLECPEDEPAILHAVEIARGIGAHVTVMYAGGHLSELVLPEAPPRTGRARPRLQIEARALLAEQTEAARATFNDIVSRHGFTVADAPVAGTSGTVSFEVRRGAIEVAVQEAAVLHDAVVFFRDEGSAVVETVGYSVIRSSLESSGRPVLLLPKTLPRPFASGIAIGWNGSLEGAHAVSAAMSLITAAKSVHVLTVGTPKTAVGQGEQLRDYLAWHGVQAQVRSATQDGRSAAATLLDLVNEVGADLLVMGGYTRSRLRQTIFGGMTSHMVSKARVPVFLSK